MLQLILLSLGAYVLQASASPAFSFPPISPSIEVPTLPTLSAASLPTDGVIPTPIVLTSVPGASIPTTFPSLPGTSIPSIDALTALTASPSLPGGVSIPSAGLPTPTLLGGVIPTPEFPTSGLPDLPTTSFPALPTLTNLALLSSLSAALSGVAIPTSVPVPDLSFPYRSSLGGLTSLPIPNLPLPTLTLPNVIGTATGLAGSLTPVSIVTNLSSAIDILEILIRLIQEIINNGGVRVPGVAEFGIVAGTNVLEILLKVVADFLDKAGAVGAIAL